MILRYERMKVCESLKQINMQKDDVVVLLLVRFMRFLNFLIRILKVETLREFEIQTTEMYSICAKFR